MKIVKYFFEFISIISLFCIFKIIGLRNASNLGSILGRSIGPLFRSKHITKQNIKIGLGEMNLQKESEIINDIFDLRPFEIESRFKLRDPIYSETSSYGHMGRKCIKKTKHLHFAFF